MLRIARAVIRANRRANRAAKRSWNDPKWQKKGPPKPKPVVIVPVAAPVQEVDRAYLPKIDESGMQWRRTLTFPPWDTTQS